MQYRGASPEEVEQSILLPIEAEVRSLELTRRIESSASEGTGLSHGRDHARIRPQTGRCRK